MAFLEYHCVLQQLASPGEYALSTIRRGHRLYFAAVGLLALWVGGWGYFSPSHLDRILPWLVTPLHARFLGAMSLSCAAFMCGCMLAQRWSEVRAVVPVIVAATGMLFVVSLFYRDRFDWSRPEVWLWFAAALAYPLVGLALMWRERGAREPFAEGAELRAWARTYLSLQGVVVTALALILLLAPEFMVALWPWQVTPLMAQIFASPFLAYGIASLLAARRRTWPEAWIPVSGTFLFAALVLLAVYLDRGSFDLGENAARVWIAGFAAATLLLLITIVSHFGSRRARRG